MMTDPTITLHTDSGEARITLRPEDVRIAVRYSVLHAFGENPLQAGLCGFGVAYPKLRRQVPYRHDVMDHGARVLEHLVGLGVPYHELRACADMAIVLLCRDLVGGEEVDAAEDFTDPPTGGSDG